MKFALLGRDEVLRAHALRTSSVIIFINIESRWKAPSTPLSLDVGVNACSQKSSRDPVMNPDDGSQEVDHQE
jgi:uncharacterized protein YceH (UPF0502 family)